MQLRQNQPLLVLASVGRLRDDLTGLISLIVFMGITALLFRSWEFALLVTASLGFHELGHALVLVWFRLDYRIYFGVVGAYTWSRLSQRAVLSHLANSAVHLAGPLFSLALALGALSLHQLWQPDSRHLLVLANFSAHVGFLNLLPLGELTDGGKVLRRMVHSAEIGRVRAYVVLLSATAFIAPLMSVAWHLLEGETHDLMAAGAGFVLIGMWLAASLLIELRRNSGQAAQNDSRLMSAGQVIFLALVTWDILAALLVVILATPFWLEPHYVLGSLANIEMLLAWLVQIL
jgi:hypothetical protein